MNETSIEQLIKKLSDRVDKYQSQIKIVQGKVKGLKNQFSLDQDVIAKQEKKIKGQEKELKTLENKLFKCSNDRDEIQGKLDKKVAELEQSNLSKEQIAEQTIQLLTKSGFTEVRGKLLETWSNYAKSKDSFNELQRNLDSSRLKTIQILKENKRNL